MKLLKNKDFLCIIGIIAGVAAFVLSWFLRENEIRVLSGLLIGVGVFLFSYSLSTLLNRKIALKHPEATRKKDIEVNDERNILIKAKAGARTNTILFYIISVVCFIFALLGAELYVVIIMALLILLNAALYIGYVNYYGKRL